MKELIRMNRIAGLITEGQARKLMDVLNEEEMSPLDKLKKKKYIEEYLSWTIDPYDFEFSANVDVLKIDAHAKKFGYEDTLNTIDDMDRKESERSNLNIPPSNSKSPEHSLTMRDPLQHLTKKGKMNKLDVDRLKINIKRSLGID